MSDLSNLRKFVAPEIIFGNGARKLSGKYVRQLGGRKVLIVTDPGVIAAGWLAEVQKSIEETGIPYAVFADVSPNPRSEEVARGTDVYKTEGCNMIVSVGGGSPMDCAKGIGIMATNNKHILNFEGVDKIQIPIPPLVFIPTTAGTSADVSQFAIITNKEELVKIAIVSKAVVPDVALIDPETTQTMDNYLTACTGMDALVHAIEAFVSTGSGPMTDLYALEAIRLVSQNLPLLLQDPTNAHLREQIMLASMKAGLAFSNAILGAVHAMAHSLGGFLDLPHGECNALLLDHVVNFNYSHSPERFKIIAEYMGLDIRGLNSTEIKTKLQLAIRDLRNRVGITDALEHRGVSISDIPQLSSKAIQDACMLTNPRVPNVDDIKTIYKEAL